MRIIRLLLGFVSMALTVLLIASPFLLLSRQPLVEPRPGSEFDDISDAHDIIKRFDVRRMMGGQTHIVNVTDDELDRAVHAVTNRVANVRTRIEVREDELWAEGTIKLPKYVGLLGEYLNVGVTVAPSPAALEVTRLRVGAVEVPAWIVRPVFVYAADWLIGDGKGEQIYGSVKSVAISGHRLTVALQPPATLKADVKSAAGNFLAMGEREAIRTYYQELVEAGKEQRGAASVPLANFLKRVFKRAEVRSAKSDPVSENRAAILALAVYFGDRRFAILLREVTEGNGGEDNFDRSRVVLQGRHDWVQHFSTTAGLQVAAGSGLSNFVGEVKEVADTDGPSGFSFTDIAADRTGVRFAEVATASEASGRLVQQSLSGEASEASFFPLVKDLPEGLSEASFKGVYADVNSDKYLHMIDRIDARIGSVKLYRLQ